ncbi:MAG: hypothetical protein GX113_04210 [Actinobacteria bacterium]|nr:hypothetical protein [Actinomycetota bacterium]
MAGALVWGVPVDSVWGVAGGGLVGGPTEVADVAVGLEGEVSFAVSSHPVKKAITDNRAAIKATWIATAVILPGRLMNLSLR